MIKEPGADRPRSEDELPNAWRGFNALRQRMDDGIAATYEALSITGVSTRFSMAIMFLADAEATIGDLATRCGVTHSAMSQSVQAMRHEGLVTTKPGADRRSVTVSLTSEGQAIAPMLWKEWYATEAALAELEAETGHAIDSYVAAMSEALDARSFAERIRDRFDE